MKKPIALFTVLAALIACKAAADETEYYQVEVAILSGPSISQVMSQQATGLGYPGQILRLTSDEEATDQELLTPTDDDTQSSEQADDSIKPVVFWHQQEQLEFTQFLTKLRRKGYRPLWHEQWFQPVQGRATGQSVLIDGGREYEKHHELEGSVTVFKQSYPHLSIDLWFSQFTTTHSFSNIVLPPKPLIDLDLEENSYTTNGFDTFNGTNNLSTTTDDRFNFDQPVLNKNLYQVDAINTLKQSRRVNLNQIIYFDGPGLIALAKITPLKQSNSE